MTLRLRWTPQGAEFAGQGVWGEALASAFPIPEGPAPPVDSAVRLLDRFLMDAEAEVVGDGVLLPNLTIHGLDPHERIELGIAPILPDVDVSLRTEGYVGLRGALAVAATVRTRLDGAVLPIGERVGVWIPGEHGGWVLPPMLHSLLERIDGGSGESLEEQHRFVADVRKLAEKTGADLGAYLQSQNYTVPDGVGVEVEAVAPDHLILRPTAEGTPLDFETFTNETGPVRTTYSRRDGTSRHRLLLDRQQRETADGLLRLREVKGADVPRFLENPEAFLPDGVDLSQFSPRVRGVIPQRYRSQPYLDVREGQKARDWFTVSPRIELLAEEAAQLFDSVSHPGSAGAQAASGTPDATDPRGSAGQIAPGVYADLCRKALDSGESHVLHDGAWVEIDPEKARRFLDALDAAEETPEGDWRLPRDRAGFVLDVISNVHELEFSVEGAGVLLTQPPDYPLPESLAAELYPHQEFGYRWLRFLHENSLGGLLADDMGLGKTVQVAALFAHLAERSELRPSLLVLPNSLVPNWQNELERFCPSIRAVHEHHGSQRIRSADFLSQWDLVITTYGTLRRDQLTLAKVDWKVVACDEAQNVKNPSARATAAVKAMKARLKLALTGTPVENGLSELWCIVDYIQAGKLGSWSDFRTTFERPMVEAGEGDHFEIARRLQGRLDPHYVRRTKKDVLTDLPQKNVVPRPVALGNDQAAIYARVIEEMRRGSRIPIEALQLLIQVCSHPALLRADASTVEDLLADCPKLQTTLDILSDIRDRGEKAVVFTRYRRMQDILQDVIQERLGAYAPIINGESAGRARQARIDTFNARSGFGVLILSPEAAGVGLNITGANHVIHYTRLWNPARENQATDRVHRLGQTRPVTVYHPLVQGDGFTSVEEHLDALLKEKSALADNVLWPRESLSVMADLERLLVRPE